MRTDTGQVFHLSDYRPTDFIIERVDLTFRLDPERTRVSAGLAMRRREGSDPTADLVLDGDALRLEELLLDDAPLEPSRYTATPDRLTICGLPKQDRFVLTIDTMLAPDDNTQLMGLYRSSGVYCTQCEAEGFRRITYFLDRPDVLAIYTTRIEARKSEAPRLLSNGNLVEHGDLDKGWHYALWHDPHPKPSYLFALVGGDLDVLEDRFVTRSGREVKLQIFVEHGNTTRADYAMDALKRSMRWDEEVFGCEYDLDVFMIVAVSDFNMGAMENKGLNIFNDKYILADPQTATDQDYANIEAIVAHEYFHNWTGNRITCRDWFQLCLKEGLTVYRDHEFSADMRSRVVKRIAEVRLLKAHQFPEDSGPLAHPVRPRTYREINNFYTATVYEKGSEVVGMIRTLLGADNFSRGLDLYFRRHDGDAATVEDFLACFAEASGRDLSQFALWYTQAGTPGVKVSSVYDAASGRLTVEFQQSVPPTPGQPDKQAMHIPLKFGLVTANGSDAVASAITGADVTELREAGSDDPVLHLTEERHTVVFEGLGQRPVLSLNRGFSAPIKLTIDREPDDIAFLARHDSDLYSRWQAINELATTDLIRAADLAGQGKSVTITPGLVSALVESAADQSLEPAFRAQILSLPSEADIAREMAGTIDPDAILAGRNQVLEAIAKAGRDVFADLFSQNAGTGPYRPDAGEAGRRALRMAAMTFLAIAEGSSRLAARVYEEADNMTEMAQALSFLAHRHPDDKATRAALAGFETRFGDNPLVIDKWLSIQAMTPGPATLDNVKALMKTPHYDAANPNRVRALVGAFATGNATGFNRKDGLGYRFVARQVLRIDRHNPQLAARILTAFRSWRSLEAGRSDKAGEALGMIAETRPLSSDVSDIVERILME